MSDTDEQQASSSPGKLRPLATLALLLSIVGGLFALVENRLSDIRDDHRILVEKVESIDVEVHKVREMLATNTVTHSVLQSEIDALDVRLSEYKQDNAVAHRDALEDRIDIKSDLKSLLRQKMNSNEGD